MPSGDRAESRCEEGDTQTPGAAGEMSLEMSVKHRMAHTWPPHSQGCTESVHSALHPIHPNVIIMKMSMDVIIMSPQSGHIHCETESN